MGFYTRNGNYIGSAIGSNRAGIFTDGEEQFGRIGPYVAPTTTTATGIYDEFDVFNSRKSNIWPLPVTYSTSISTTQYENQQYTCTVTTTNLPTNTTLYWTIAYGTATVSDFGTTSGSFTQSSSTQTGSFTITPVLRIPDVGSRTYNIQIRTGSASGPIVATTSTITISGCGTCTVLWSASPVNEGSLSQLRLSFTNTVGQSVSRSFGVTYSGTANASADFTTALLSSYNTSTFQTSIVSATALVDLTTEGNETLTATITYGANTIGSATLTINDTSLTITASVTPSTTTINEGSSVTFNVTTTNVLDGTTLYYTVENSSGMEDNDLSSLRGTFTVTSNAGSFTLTPTSDSLTEGTESFVVKIRALSPLGTVYATSAVVSISDTSTGTTESTTAVYTGVSGNRTPLLGIASASPWPPTAPSAWTSVQNASVDDTFLAISLPFTWYIAGTGYTTVYVGSNAYVTFGAGSSQYSSLSASNPPNPKICWGSADRSYQRVAYLSSGTLWTKIRWEGTATTSGTPGASTVLVELTLFNPTNVVGGGSLAELCIGNSDALSGLAMVASATTAYATYTLAQSTSYVFAGDSTGVTWTINSSYHVPHFL